LPVVLATLLYLTGWRPSSSGNHGELIQPVRQVDNGALQTLDGQSAHFSGLRGKWLMVHFGPSSCPEECMKNIYTMRQIHAAQAKEIGRVQRVFVATDMGAAEKLKAKLVDYPEMRVWTGKKQALAEVLQSFGVDAGQPAEQQGIYLVDPLGNLIMRYPPGTDPGGMLKDLTRLLKYSWVG
jgi:cytochrome oxidase Cu insertion factor (SCO1/SenC/PrrC family)